jgi:ribose-phosphate pyrophosphokinase
MSVKIFSGRATQYLSEKIANAYGEPLGAVNYQQFSDGEMSPFISESVRGHDVFIIQSTFPPADNLMELLLMVDAAKRASSHNVNVLSPTLAMPARIEKISPGLP